MVNFINLDPEIATNRWIQLGFNLSQPWDGLPRESKKKIVAPPMTNQNKSTKDWFPSFGLILFMYVYYIYIYSIDSLGIPFVSPCVFLHPCSFTWGEPAQNEGPLLDLG